MVEDNIEQNVFDLVNEYNGPRLFLIKRYPLKPTTDLNEDFRMDPIDAYELLERYVEVFNIEPSDIDFEQHFPENLSKNHDPLTIQLMIDSAKAGRWLRKSESARSCFILSSVHLWRHMPRFLKVRLFIAARISARPKVRINPRVNILWPYMLENKMKKIMLAVTALLLTAGCSAVQAEPIHADVKASQDNAEDCEHFAGEWDSSLPENQQKEIEAGIDKNCTAARQQQEQLRKIYPGNKQI